MVLDHVDDLTDEYVIQNTSFEHGGAVLRIPKTREYYAFEYFIRAEAKINSRGEIRYAGKIKEMQRMRLVNEDFGNTMKQNTWYLLPQAYSLTLVPEPQSSDSSSSDDESSASDSD